MPNLPSGGNCNLDSTSLTIQGTPTNPPAPPYNIAFNMTVVDVTTGASTTRVYSISITAPTPVTLPSSNPSSLPAATVNQAYDGAINATGGVPPYTWSINGTAVTSGGISLGNGTLSASSTGGNTLSFGGQPSSTGTVNLTNVKVTDAANSTQTASYTIAVNPAGSQVSGQFFLENYCYNGS